MNLVLFDTSQRNLLYPFTLTRPVADLRVGIFTVREFWENYFKTVSYSITEKYLQQKFPNTNERDVLLINAAFIPTADFFEALKQIKDEEAITKEGMVLAAKTSLYNNWQIEDINPGRFSVHKELPGAIRYLHYPWQIFQLNDEAIRNDFKVITKGKKSAPLSPTNKTTGAENIFIEEGVKAEFVTLNAATGPIYIGKDCEIMEGSIIRGPFAMLNRSVVKMGAKIYGATTLGPNCIAGGEIKNSVLLGYSNKAHDGYLGDSVIGEWCNLGAGTSNSNLKNTAGDVNVYNKSMDIYLTPGNKCGLIMGDYSRSSINTSFNTGTITGISCNIFGEGLSPKYIPDYSWGFSNENKYHFEKACKAIDNWKRLKNQSLTEAEKNILKYIFDKL